jgi:hypothetical protein
MTTHVRSITRTDIPHEYDVVVEIGGNVVSACCRVVDYNGIRVVQQKSDLLSKLTFDPRKLVAAIVAFDAARDE